METLPARVEGIVLGVILATASTAAAQSNNSPASTIHSFGGQLVSSTAGTYFLRPWHETVTVNTAEVFIRSPRAGTIRNLFVQAYANSNSASSAVITVRKNGTDQTLSATLPASATQASDTTDTFTVAAGDQLSVKIVQNVGSNGSIIEIHADMIMVEDTVFDSTSTTNAVAIRGTATGLALAGVVGTTSNGTGAGTEGVQLATSGSGVYGNASDTGVNSTATGVYGLSNTGMGYGVVGETLSQGTGGAAGVYGIGRSGITSGVPNAPAVMVGTGNAYFNGDNPNAGQGYKNTLTPKNIVKAWISATTEPTVTINDAFNVSSATCSGGNLNITFAQPMANPYYAVIVSGVTGTGPVACYAFQKSTTGMYVQCSGVGSCPSSGAADIDALVMGAQ